MGVPNKHDRRGDYPPEAYENGLNAIIAWAIDDTAPMDADETATQILAEWRQHEMYPAWLAALERKAMDEKLLRAVESITVSADIDEMLDEMRKHEDDD